MTIETADRLGKLPPYLFAELDEMCAQVAAKGMDIIDLGVGDPDLPTPKPIIEKLYEAAQDKTNHQYPSYAGLPAFRQAASAYMEKRFGVKLDPVKQVFSLIGSKEGIAHLPLAFVNPGDLVLVPSPGYPVYNIGTLFAGGENYFLPLKEENGFLPDLDSIPADVAKRSKILHINYPNNPTSACADLSFFEKAVAFCREHDIVLAHDAAYAEMGFDGYKPPSIFEVDGALDVAIEFHSLSKTFNMTGWRLGFVCGNAKIAGGLGRIKTNIDSGAFNAIQIAGIEALENGWSFVEENMAVFADRRDVAVDGLKALGLKVFKPKATFYVWFTVPDGMTSKGFCARVLQETGVVITPGNGFGEFGEGYARMALCLPKDRIAEAVARIATVKL
jgi:LL-diaminopimelate aminotransferase